MFLLDVEGSSEAAGQYFRVDTNNGNIILTGDLRNTQSNNFILTAPPGCLLLLETKHGFLFLSPNFQIFDMGLGGGGGRKSESYITRIGLIIWYNFLIMYFMLQIYNGWKKNSLVNMNTLLYTLNLIAYTRQTKIKSFANVNNQLISKLIVIV